MRSHDELLAEAAREAASAPVDADCPSTGRHGSYSAFRRDGCRCEKTRELVAVQRRSWDTSRAEQRKQLERLVMRRAVRPEVIEAILDGRRREVSAHTHEKNVAFARAVERWGRDWAVLARRLAYTRQEVQRRLRRLDENAEGGTS